MRASVYAKDAGLEIHVPQQVARPRSGGGADGDIRLSVAAAGWLGGAVLPRSMGRGGCGGAAHKVLLMWSRRVEFLFEV